MVWRGGSHFPLLAGLVLPTPTFQALRFCLLCLHSIATVHTPTPSYRLHFSGPNFNPVVTGFPSRRSWWLLQRPGINYLPTRIAALLFPESPNFVPVSRSHSAFLRDSPRPGPTWRLPHPPRPSGVLGKSRVLEPSHLGANSPSGKSLLKHRPGRELPGGRALTAHLHLRALPSRSATGGSPGALVPSPHPGKLSRVGPPQGPEEGATVQGPPSRGSGPASAGPGSGSTRSDRPALAQGLRLRPGVGAVISMCACVCGGGGAVCVRGRRRAARGSEQGAGRLGRGLAGAGADPQ